jgi:hypothetical protein
MSRHARLVPARAIAAPTRAIVATRARARETEHLDLDALVARVAAKVMPMVMRALVSQLSAAPAVDHFDNHNLPAGWSRRRWREQAGTIAGAYRDGRTIRISKSDFDAFLRAKMTTSPVVPTLPANVTATPDPEAPWDPNEAIATTGYRCRRVIDPSAPSASPDGSRDSSEVSAPARATTSRSGGRR